jgi:nicotinamide riboside transporter PnuC
MTKNQLVGLALIVIGLIDMMAVPKILESAWAKVKHPPPWAESLNMVVRVVGLVFVCFGLSYYFFGQLE